MLTIRTKARYGMGSTKSKVTHIRTRNSVENSVKNMY